MGQPPEGAPAPRDEQDNTRLDSWKEIAAYLRRDVTTVQRWEKREGMPVHRHLHDKMGSVYAYRAELDAWVQTRNANLTADRTRGQVESPDPADDARSDGDDGSTQPRRETAAPRAQRRVGAWLAVVATAAAIAVLTVSLLDRGSAQADAIADARFIQVTDFPGSEQAAAVSPDGRFVAFLSDRDGPVDVWLTQVGSGQFANLTHGSVTDIVNPSIRALAFSPDGASVTFWRRWTGASGEANIGVWAVSILGGAPRPYLENAAEYSWSADGSRLVYHTTADGDPTFVRERGEADDRHLFAAPAGLHSHFPTWSPSGQHVYFVHGSVPDRLDIWRIPAGGGHSERVTHHDSHVSHPVFVDERTLLYLANDPDGSGPWLYTVDVASGEPRRLRAGIDRYTSLAASADSRRLVVTQSRTKHTFWRAPMTAGAVDMAAASPVPLATSSVSSGRLGPDYLLYVVSQNGEDAIWRLQAGTATELWRAPGAQVIGGPSIAPDGDRVAFSVRQDDQTRLHVMNADGTGARVAASSLMLRGAPAWAPGGNAITSAVVENGVPKLFTIPLDGREASVLVASHSQDPAWAADGRFLLYSGADVGTTFPLRGATAAGSDYPIAPLELTRGARQVRFLRGHAFIVMRGDIDRKDLWLIDPDKRVERQLTKLPPDFQLRGFDVAPDGRELLLERVEDQSDVVIIDRPTATPP